MTPYYETKLGKLYHGDCLKVMQELDVKADLCLTDPPYGIGAYSTGTMGGRGLASQSSYKATDWDSEIPPQAIFELIKFQCCNSIIFGGNYFAEYLRNSPCWLVWDKDNGKTYFADCELAWTSFKTAVRKFRFKWQGMLQEHMGKQKEKRYHPTQKPVPLMKWCLENYSKESDLILDPFFGSGTTGVACELMNRRWIGIELDEEYCEIAAKRIEEASKQHALFDDIKE